MADDQLTTEQDDLRISEDLSKPAEVKLVLHGVIRVRYAVYSDIDPSRPVKIGSYIFEDAWRQLPQTRLVAKIRDLDPVCDERIHPIIEILGIEGPDNSEDTEDNEVISE